MKEFEKDIGYRFKNKALLSRAFTHSSFANELKIESYEKLEYLGDAILEMVISKYLFLNYPDLTEGEMTKVRAQVVCENSLFEVAKKHNFSDFLKLGKGEIALRGYKKPAILADCVESLIAAIYLDSGYNKAEDFILKNLADSVENASKHVGMKDYKTVLQEKLQVHGNIDIKYETIGSDGPDHNKTFTVALFVNGKKISEGQGHSKKLAEMNAAEHALKEELI